MKTQPEIESDLEYLKAFTRATATVLDDLKNRLAKLESRAGVDYESNL